MEPGLHVRRWDGHATCPNSLRHHRRCCVPCCVRCSRSAATRQWTVGKLPSSRASVVSRAEATGQPQSLVLWRGRRLRSRHFRGRGRPLRCRHYRWKGRNSDRDKNPRAQSQKSNGTKETRRDTALFSWRPRTGLLLRCPGRSVIDCADVRSGLRLEYDQLPHFISATGLRGQELHGRLNVR